MLETSPLHELPEGWRYELDGGSSALTDAEGRYRIAVLPWTLNGSVRAGTMEDNAIALLRAVGGPGAEHRVDLFLSEGLGSRRSPRPGVAGIVRVNGQELAVAGTVEWRTREASGFVGFERGRFEAFVPAGDVRLVARLALVPGSPSPEVVVRVPEGESRSVALDGVAPVRPIAGRVRTADGEPVAGAAVCATARLTPEWTLNGRDPRHATRTDASGEYALAVMDLGLRYDVFAGGFGSDDVLTGIPPGATGVDFELAAPRSGRVRVVDGPTGAVLIPGWQVDLAGRSPTGVFTRLRLDGGRDAEGWTGFHADEDELEVLAVPVWKSLPRHGMAAGRVRLDRKAPGRIELVLGRGQRVEVELFERAPAWPEDHELLLLDERLRNAPGLDQVTSLRDLHELRRVRFDRHGRAHLFLAPGAYRFVTRPGERDWRFAPDVVEVEPGMPSVLVDWTRGE